ncbi:MAG: hypothetical protein ABUU24_01645 [Variovorax sp.]
MKAKMKGFSTALQALTDAEIKALPVIIRCSSSGEFVAALETNLTVDI